MIYFAIVPEICRFKIGHTASNLKNRLRQLQTGCPDKLQIGMTINGGTDLERELHHNFRAYRKHGEWFELNEVTAKAILWIADELSNNAQPSTPSCVNWAGVKAPLPLVSNGTRLSPVTRGD